MIGETIPQYLTHVREKEIGKGYHPDSAGTRSTREIADFMGWSLGKTRRALNKLNEDEVVSYEGKDDAPGRPDLWSIWS